MLRRFVGWFWPRRALYTAALVTAFVLGTLGLEYDIWVLDFLSTALVVLSTVKMSEPSIRRRAERRRKLERR